MVGEVSFEYIMESPKPWPTPRENAMDIGAHRLWELGIRGQGVTVAVLDSGVDSTEPDLCGKVEYDVDFTGQGPSDSIDHGTQIALHIAGCGFISYSCIGIAPEAFIANVKVFVDRPSDKATVRRGIEWCIAHYPKVRIVNLSLGFRGGCKCHECELCKSIFKATEAGLLVITAVGNVWPWMEEWDEDKQRAGPRTIFCPACSEGAMRVGSCVKQGYTWRDALQPNAFVGTSLSAALASGCAALLLSAFPKASAYDIKKAIESTGELLLEPDTGQPSESTKINVFKAYEYLRSRNAQRS